MRGLFLKVTITLCSVVTLYRPKWVTVTVLAFIELKIGGRWVLVDSLSLQALLEITQHLFCIFL